MTNNTGKLVYDIVSVPDGADLNLILRVWKRDGIVIYDSKNGGNPPVIFDRGKHKNGELIDVSSVDSKKLKEIQKLLKDESE